MKTRIISFLLALVMLFSCLSLNIFAADVKDAPQTESETTTPMTEDDIKTFFEKNCIALPGNNKLTATEISELFESVGAVSAYTKLTGSNKARHISKDGKTSTSNTPTFLSSSEAYMDFELSVHGSQGGTFACGDTFETYFQFANSDYSSYAKAAASTADVRGKSAVFSLDFKFCDTYALSDEINVFVYRTYLAHKANSTTMTTLDVVPLTISDDGNLKVKSTGEVIANLKGKADYTNIAVHFFPKENKFDVYVDGVCKVQGVTMFTNTQIEQLTFEEGKTYKNGSTAITFTDLPKGNGDFLPSVIRIMQRSTTYHTGTCCDKTPSAFLSLSGDQYSLKNMIWYNSETYIGCAHKWSEYSHSHDLLTESQVLRATCEWCGKSEEKIVPVDKYLGSYDMDKNTISDKLTSGDIIINGNIDDDNNFGITNQKRKTGYIAAFVDYDGDTKATVGTDLILYATDLITKKTDTTESGTNSYLTWAAKIYSDSAATKLVDLSYKADADGNLVFNDANVQNFVGKPFYAALTGSTLKKTEEAFSPEVFTECTNGSNSYANLITFDEVGNAIWNGYTTGEYINKSLKDLITAENYLDLKAAGVIGAPYAITYDFRWHGTKAVGGLFEMPRFYKAGDTKTYVDASYNVSVAADGSFKYFDTETGEYVDTKIDLEVGEWYQITVYHTPRGLDGIRSNADDNTYHVLLNGKLVKTGIQAVADDQVGTWDYAYTDENGITHTDTISTVSDFTLGYFRAGQNKRGFDMDDLRIYRGSLLECAHKDANGAHTVKNGVCTTCKAELRPTIRCEMCNGYVIASDVLVVSRSASIGDSIAFNAYVKLDKEAADYGDAKLVLDTTAAGGSKKAEFAISELSPETEGENKGLYKITLPLRSIDMTREITVTYEAVGDTNTYPYKTTINDYLDELLATPQKTAVSDLVKAMKNYGSYAQIYFAGMNGNPEDLADILPNAKLSDNDKNAIDSVGAEDLAAYAPVITGNAVTVTEGKLVLTSHTEMKIYFKGSNNVKAYESVSEDATATETPLPIYNSEIPGEYYVILTEPTPLTFDKERTVVFKDGENQTTATLSVYSLLHLVITSTDSTAIPDSFKDLARSLYLLGEKAKEYKDMMEENTVPKKNWDDDGVLKILCVGNSFSVDACEWLAYIANGLGVEIEIGNLYIGGCDIDKHISVLTGNPPVDDEGNVATYTYYHFDNTEKTSVSKVDGAAALGYISENNWDFITLQQASKYTNLPEKHENLSELIEIVEGCNANAKIAWHMTWAYQEEYISEKMSSKVSQINMYNGIVSTVQSSVLPLIDLVIPTGTAIQNARTSSLGNDLTCDGLHLDKGVGRYIAGLTYFAALTGIDISRLEWVPPISDAYVAVDETARSIAIKSVRNAIEEPFDITSGETNMWLNGKKIIFIGNSYIYWGKTVLESSAKTQAARQNDQGYFYQLCKKMGVEVEVTNWTFGGHGVGSIFSDNCSHCSYDHKSYLEDRYYDYVVISPGAESNFDKTIIKVMDFFREANPNVKFIVMGTACAYGYNSTYSTDYCYQKDLLAGFEDQGILIADWGGLMDGILRGEYSVPNATQDYSINSFIVKDGKHGTMLTGYIQSMLIYSLLTGDSATTLPYDFCLDTSIRAEFDADRFISKNTTETYGTNFVEIFNSEADMNGLQQLVDWVLKNKPYRND
ncbi:MAG: DUF4886 domain-containing protein [Clostridia bacterium]|nr:DUF4886 domain-containing protein [Clostridia bacterium]